MHILAAFACVVMLICLGVAPGQAEIRHRSRHGGAHKKPTSSKPQLSPTVDAWPC
jgi:hypothetical protein